MIGPKEQAGLDMPDFQIINDVLKVSVYPKWPYMKFVGAALRSDISRKPQ